MKNKIRLGAISGAGSGVGFSPHVPRKGALRESLQEDEPGRSRVVQAVLPPGTVSCEEHGRALSVGNEACEEPGALWKTGLAGCQGKWVGVRHTSRPKDDSCDHMA